MNNFIEVEYEQSGKSTKANKYGMREMQERAFRERNAQYLLIKSPPASGKSRALMFIALDKLKNQSIKKVIVAVPEDFAETVPLDETVATFLLEVDQVTFLLVPLTFSVLFFPT